MSDAPAGSRIKAHAFQTIRKFFPARRRDGLQRLELEQVAGMNDNGSPSSTARDLLHHLVGAGEQCRWDNDAKRLCGL
jgi:hypothetical protein